MKIYILSSVWRRFTSNESNSRTFRESLLILVWGCSQKDQAYVTIGSTPPSTVDSIILLELFFLAWWVFCPPRNPLIQDTPNWGPNFIFPTLIKYLFNDNFYYSGLINNRLIFRDKSGMPIRDSARRVHDKSRKEITLFAKRHLLFDFIFSKVEIKSCPPYIS